MRTLVLSLILVLSLFSFLSPSGAATDNGVKVGVFYYPWYAGDYDTGHWDGHPKDYGINLPDTWWTVIDIPYLRWYASNDMSVIRQHLEWFKYAGIDFGIISWWGPDCNKTVFDDGWVKTLFDETESYAPWFRWVISIEGGEPAGWQRLRDWVYYNYTTKYSNIWLNDTASKQPFLFWMNGHIPDDNTTRQLILADPNCSVRILGQSYYVNWTTWTPYTGCNATTALPPSSPDGFMSVMPRYDETRLDPNNETGNNVNRTICCDPRLDGSTRGNEILMDGVPLYDKQWSEVLSNASAGNVKLVAIATWNDFTERTQIEPCHDYTSAYGLNPLFLLDKTKFYINQLKATQVGHEFQPLVILPSFIVVTAIVIVIYKTKQVGRGSTKSSE